MSKSMPPAIELTKGEVWFAPGCHTRRQVEAVAYAWYPDRVAAVIPLLGRWAVLLHRLPDASPADCGVYSSDEEERPEDISGPWGPRHLTD